MSTKIEKLKKMIAIKNKVSRNKNKNVKNT